MDYEALVSKIASANLPINAQLQDVINRVKVAGLHTATARMHGVPEFTAKTATMLLGAQLLKTHYKHQKIAEGLALLPESPTDARGVKEANFLKNLLGKSKSVFNRGFSEGSQAVRGAAAPRGIAGLESMGRVDPNYAPDARHIFNTLGAHGRAKRVALDAAEKMQVQPSLRFSQPQNAANPNFQKYMQGTTTPEALAAQSRARLLAGKT